MNEAINVWVKTVDSLPNPYQAVVALLPGGLYAVVAWSSAAKRWFRPAGAGADLGMDEVVAWRYIEDPPSDVIEEAERLCVDENE